MCPFLLINPVCACDSSCRERCAEAMERFLARCFYQAVSIDDYQVDSPGGGGAGGMWFGGGSGGMGGLEAHRK